MKPHDPLAPAVDSYRKGGVIAFPTETFYGLGVDPFNEEAVERLFALKKRPPDKPVSLIIKDWKMLGDIAAEAPQVAVELAKKFWPGPLTIIFKAKNLPEILIAKTGRIGVRVSNNPIARDIISATGSPITATSANPSGKPPAKTPEAVLGYFDGNIDILIDGGELKGRFGSTIIDVTGNHAVIVREGEIPAEKILAFLRTPP
ncbi:MAG: threonylcarbamoyl-AMP synthase [Deltaproteobacteria bacterium]|nr:threonylcarbamoyl-AMP synthase [Deltaproteobacteria bacterium]